MKFFLTIVKKQIITKHRLLRNTDYYETQTITKKMLASIENSITMAAEWADNRKLYIPFLAYISKTRIAYAYEYDFNGLEKRSLSYAYLISKFAFNTSCLVNLFRKICRPRF